MKYIYSRLRQLEVEGAFKCCDCRHCPYYHAINYTWRGIDVYSLLERSGIELSEEDYERLNELEEDHEKLSQRCYELLTVPKVAVPKKAVAYARTATEAPLGESRCKTQLVAIEKYANAQDIEIVATFEDRCKSGSTINGRQGFIRMLAAIESGAIKVDYIIVDRLSRVSRNSADVVTTLQRLERCEVALICTEGGLNNSNAIDKLLVQLSMLK